MNFLINIFFKTHVHLERGKCLVLSNGIKNYYNAILQVYCDDIFIQ
jgi:hypothetical protein